MVFEDFGPEFVHGGEEVGKGDVLVDVEAFDLVEEDMGAGADVLIAVDGARGDDADGRFVGLEDADLGVGGVGAEEHVGADVEGVLHVAGGMVGRKVEPFVVVVVGIDVGAVLDGEAHAGEDLDGLVAHAGDEVLVLEEGASAGKGDVDLFFLDPLGLFGEGEAFIGLGGELGDFFFELVDPFAKAGSVFGGAVAEVSMSSAMGPFLPRYLTLSCSTSLECLTELRSDWNCLRSVDTFSSTEFLQK